MRCAVLLLCISFYLPRILDKVVLVTSWRPFPYYASLHAYCVRCFPNKWLLTTRWDVRHYQELSNRKWIKKYGLVGIGREVQLVVSIIGDAAESRKMETNEADFYVQLRFLWCYSFYGKITQSPESRIHTRRIKRDLSLEVCKFRRLAVPSVASLYPIKSANKTGLLLNALWIT